MKDMMFQKQRVSLTLSSMISLNIYFLEILQKMGNLTKQHKITNQVKKGLILFKYMKKLKLVSGQITDFSI